jgi:hypothetical protein
MSVKGEHMSLPFFPPGARVYLDGVDEAIVRAVFPRGSLSFAFPHYRVDIVNGDRFVAIRLNRVRVERKDRQ